MSTPQNIHPTFGQLLGREAKETLLNQSGLVVWLYGCVVVWSYGCVAA